MSINCNRPSLTAAAFVRQARASLKPLFCLIVLAVATALCLARTEDPADQYVGIVFLIQKADSLAASAKTGPALAKYQEAQTALRNFQKNRVDWNPNVVAYRLNYLAEKIAALSQPATTPSTTVPGGDTQTEARESASALKLLDAGAEPRKVLRLHPSPGDKQTCALTLKIGMTTRIAEAQAPGMSLPAVKTTMEVTIKSVSPDGDITYEMVLSDASVAEDAETMPQTAEVTKASMAKFKGLVSTGTMSNRGFRKSTETSAPPGADAKAKKLLDEMNDALSSLATLLPEEAVGAGARWEVASKLKSRGVTIDQTTTYQLVSIEGERVTTKVTTTQRAANQIIQSPTIPQLKTDLLKMAGRGTGEITFDLGQLLPVDASSDTHTDATTSSNLGGFKQPMTMATDVNLRFEGK
jgi:hypothetical protein